MNVALTLSKNALLLSGGAGSSRQRSRSRRAAGRDAAELLRDDQPGNPADAAMAAVSILHSQSAASVASVTAGMFASTIVDRGVCVSASYVLEMPAAPMRRGSRTSR